jgi:hypothetical protein
VTVLIPFPPQATAKEDALAYWTPAPYRAETAEPAKSRPAEALDQMYRYYSQD